MPSLKEMSRKELEKLITQIEKQLEKREASEKKEALAAAKKAAQAHGYSLDEIIYSPPKKTKAKPVPKTSKNAGNPKYAHPDDRSVTWTGKGRRPKWYQDAVGVWETA